MLCPTCLGSNMKDQGQYYQCPRCGDIQTKYQDRGVRRFKEACLKRREPTIKEKILNTLSLFRVPITCGILITFLVWGLMILQMGGRG